MMSPTAIQTASHVNEVKATRSLTSHTVTVKGIDLFPPPQTWVPPNCLLEVDDATKVPWTFDVKFDLIHLRWMVGSFSRLDYRRIYAEAYRYVS